MDGGLWTIRGLNDEYPKGTFDVHDWIAHNIKQTVWMKQ